MSARADLYPFDGLVAPIDFTEPEPADSALDFSCALTGTPGFYAGPLFDFVEPGELADG